MSLYSIDVEANTNSEEFDHAEILISAGAWRALDTAGVTNADVWKAHIDVGGIISRLALHASPWVVAAAARHGCHPAPLATPPVDALRTPHLRGCTISGFSPNVLAPGSDLREPPTVCLFIPADEVDAWIDRIGLWLDAIATDAAARPRSLAHDASAPTPLRLIQPGRAS